MPAAAERMSRVDTAWLRMDNDVNLMMIVGVMLLQPGISLDALRERVASKLLKFDRFRQRVEHDAVGAMWVEDADFDLNRHVVPGTLTRQTGQSERDALQHLCGLLAAIPLDARHPLWEFQLIEDYDGGSALVVRTHHCLADGMALVTALMSLTDGAADPPRRASAPAPGPADADWLADALIKPVTDIALKAMSRAGDGVSRSMEALSQPDNLAGPREAARTGLQVLQDVAALALMADDSHTPLKGRPLGVKHVAWCEPLPLADVKAVGKALGCSINDVLLSCAAGAIGQWLRDKGHSPSGQSIRAMVPVNLRAPENAWQLGNRFGLAPLVLPIGIENPVERVYDVNRRMADMKGSYQPLMAYAVLSLSGLFVKPVQDSLLGLFAKKSTAVMTNVPGPAQALKLCGATLRQALFWVPASGDIGVGVSILSYNGGVQFGLITDEHMCASPQQIVDRFAAQFDSLLLTTLMLPWAGEAAA